MRLPKSVQRIADVIGQDKALALVRTLRRELKGKTLWIYVPQSERLHVNHRLVHLLGWEDASALAEEFGGSHLYPSSCRYLVRAVVNRQVLALRDTGMTVPEIAGELRFSAKWVEAIVEAREMYRKGMPVEVVARAVKISPLTLGFILDVDVMDDGDPVKPRRPGRERSPQQELEL